MNNNQWQQPGGPGGANNVVKWLCIFLGVLLAAGIAVIAVRLWQSHRADPAQTDGDTAVIVQPASVPVTGISIVGAEDPTAVLTVQQGESTMLQAVLQPEGAEADVRWSSGDETIAKVDSSGKVSCLKPGLVVITAAAGDLTAQVMVEVAEPQQSNAKAVEQTPSPAPQQSGTRVDTRLGAHFTVPEGFYELPQSFDIGYAYRYRNDALDVDLCVYESRTASHPESDSARECIELDYQNAHEGVMDSGNEVTFQNPKESKWVLSGYLDERTNIFYYYDVASDDDTIVYAIRIYYPAANANVCNEMVGAFIKGFTYDN